VWYGTEPFKKFFDIRIHLIWHLHLVLGRKWKVTIFYTFCVKTKVRIFNTEHSFGNDT
jgi:hypothetical protein